MAIALSVRALLGPATQVLFATAAQWLTRLAEAHAAGRFHAELLRLGRYPLGSKTDHRPRHSGWQALAPSAGTPAIDQRRTDLR